MDNFNDYLQGKKKLMGSFDNDNSKIVIKSTFDKVYVEANKEGLLCLAKYLIDFAYDNNEVYPDHIHLYCSNQYSTEPLSENSEELIIKKID